MNKLIIRDIVENGVDKVDQQITINIMKNYIKKRKKRISEETKFLVIHSNHFSRK